MAEALMRSRDGTVPQDIAPFDNPMYPHQAVGDTGSMKRWEAILRFNVALFDLLSGLQFSSHQDEAAPQKGHAVLSVGGSPLVTMYRPDQDFFEKQFDLVKSYAEIRADRAAEIVTQMQPQVPFWSAAVHMHPSHTPKTLELVELALGFASIMCMRFKQAMAVPRPIDWSTEIQPIIATPSHSAYPSGHSTEAHMIAYTLPTLVAPAGDARNAMTNQLLKQAHRIAENRTVAGVHFPVDSIAGRALAKALAAYFLAQCGKGNPVNPQVVLPTDAKADFMLELDAQPGGEPIALTLPATNQRPLAWIAEQAGKEWT